MKKASITEAKNQLSALIDRVRHGESVVITDRGRPVARLEPVRGTAAEDDEMRLDRLERAGIIRRPKTPPSKAWVKKLIARRLPRATASVLQALLDERAEGR